MPSAKSSIVEKQLACIRCGYVRTVWRRPCRNKKRGHLKTMHCPTCREPRATFYEL